MGNRADLGRGLSLAFEFAGAVALFWFLGRLVDNWLDTDPWGQVVASVFGWVGGFLHVYYATLPAKTKVGTSGRATDEPDQEAAGSGGTPD